MRTHRWGRLALASLLVAIGGGCIGSIDRDDFDRVIQERGGGLTSDLPLDAVDAVRRELGVDDFEIRLMTVTPSSETALLHVRDPAAPENLDQYLVHRGDVDAVEPIRLMENDDLDQQTFPVSSVAFDRTEEMVDAALAEFDAQDGYVTSASVDRSTDGEVTIDLALESPRSRATATFTAEGRLVEVVRT